MNIHLFNSIINLITWGRKRIENHFDVDSICDALQIERIKNNLILDGGNVVKTERMQWWCVKSLFWKSSFWTRKILEQMLRELFEVEKLWFLPNRPGDFTGHADGMVRFLIKTLSWSMITLGNLKHFKKSLILLSNLPGWILLKYHTTHIWKHKSNDQANGIYITTFKCKIRWSFLFMAYRKTSRQFVCLNNSLRVKRLKPSIVMKLRRRGGCWIVLAGQFKLRLVNIQNLLSLILRTLYWRNSPAYYLKLIFYS